MHPIVPCGRRRVWASLSLAGLALAGWTLGIGPSPAASLPTPTGGGSVLPGKAFARTAVGRTASVDSTLRPLRRGEPGVPPAARPAFVALAGPDTLRLTLTALTVLPGEGIEVGGDAAHLWVQAGGVREVGPGRWWWTAPLAPGAYALRLEGEVGQFLHLTAWVAHPAERVRNGSLRGYRIGSYRSLPPGGDEAYRPPDGFVEVPAADQDLLVSPRFTVGEFLCKQPGEPRYLALSRPLLVKLEAVAERVAAAGLVSVTAWRGLTTRGGLRPGERVLITGGSGGVSTMAIQIAALAGAEVHAVTSGQENVRRVRELGADVAYDRTAEDYAARVREETGGRGVDLVLDSVGEALWESNLKALAVRGRLVTYGATTGARGATEIRLVFWKQLEILGSTMGTPAEFREVMGLVFRGVLEPVIHQVLPLEEARRAHEMLEEGRVFGKLVLTP